MQKTSKKTPFGLCVGAFLLLLINFSCQRDKGKNIPDVAHFTEVPEWVHFEEVLCPEDGDSNPQILDQARKNYPAFWDLFFTQVVPLVTRDMPPDTRDSVVLQFVSDERVRWLCDTSAMILGDWSGWQASVDEAFRFHQHYFPEKDLPRMYSLISEFGYLPFIFEDVDGRNAIGVSLEMFLGEDFPYRAYVGLNPAFSAYMTRTYNRDHFAMRILEVLVDDYCGFPPGERLIDQMIHNGKKKYILSRLLPMTPDSVIMAYSQEDLAWCRENERNIWAHFLHSDLLYNQDRLSINKLITPGPNAPGMPPEAPGNTGTWIGWRIISAYMERYPETSLSGLIYLDNAQDILEKSKYKPRM